MAHRRRICSADMDNSEEVQSFPIQQRTSKGRIQQQRVHGLGMGIGHKGLAPGRTEKGVNIVAQLMFSTGERKSKRSNEGDAVRLAQVCH